MKFVKLINLAGNEGGNAAFKKFENAAATLSSIEFGENAKPLAELKNDQHSATLQLIDVRFGKNELFVSAFIMPNEGNGGKILFLAKIDES